MEGFLGVHEGDTILGEEDIGGVLEGDVAVVVGDEIDDRLAILRIEIFDRVVFANLLEIGENRLDRIRGDDEE